MPRLDDRVNMNEDDLINNWSEFPLGVGGRVNEKIIQPKIFTSTYNTPDSFRHGVEVKLNSDQSNSKSTGYGYGNAVLCWIYKKIPKYIPITGHSTCIQM